MLSQCSVLTQADAEQFGIDWEGPGSLSNDDDSVVIPVTETPLSESDMTELDTSIPHLLDLYEKTKEFILHKIN